MIYITKRNFRFSQVFIFQIVPYLEFHFLSVFVLFLHISKMCCNNSVHLYHNTDTHSEEGVLIIYLQTVCVCTFYIQHFCTNFTHVSNISFLTVSNHLTPEFAYPTLVCSNIAAFVINVLYKEMHLFIAPSLCSNTRVYSHDNNSNLPQKPEFLL